MILAVVGSRTFTDYTWMCDVLDALQPDSIVSGGARGADSLAERWAKERGVPCKVIPAEWDKYGKRAGHLRNEQIVLAADEVLAFWDGESRGTDHTVRIAKSRGTPVTVLEFDWYDYRLK